MFIYYYFSLSPTECSTTCYPLPPTYPPARLPHCPKEMIKIIQRSLDRFMKNVAWILRWFHFHPKLNWFSPFPSRSLAPLSLSLAVLPFIFFYSLRALLANLQRSGHIIIHPHYTHTHTHLHHAYVHTLTHTRTHIRIH